MLFWLLSNYRNGLVFLVVGVQGCVMLFETLYHLGNFGIVPPILLRPLTPQRISLFAYWRGRLRWGLLVAHLWALIPWKSNRMCGFGHSVPIGMMHPSECSWSCRICGIVFLHPDSTPGSRGVGDILSVFSPLLSFVLPLWSLNRLILCCLLPLHSTGYCRRFFGF